MKQRTATWFICKVNIEKTMEDGLVKKVTEQYVVDALSFSEAEARITELLSTYAAGTMTVEDISRAPFREIFFTENDEDDKWYKAKLAFITLDERTEKEKRTNVTYLVQGKSLDGAIKHVNEVMSSTLIEYASLAMQETQIMDVYER